MINPNLCNVNGNFLMNNGYQLIIPKFPHVQFFANAFTFPGLTLPMSKIENPFTAIPVPGEKVEYEPITITFIVDEDLNNYEEVYKWLTSIAFDTDNLKFTTYQGKNSGQELGQQDIKVITLTNKGNKNVVFTFIDAIPVSLSGFSMTQQDPITNYVQATVTFEYTNFTISRD
jgi:hypothetical protein